ncbi:hypothetical protein VHEMI03755 [[Torrubiella] hemipterigena]|uniref:Uncharacterized protein n=1 Tax=[Torrubiella] hemipterigena TaxID=1531966 RepID=A0A0A1TEC5_9HYPO|nr:hypothetical protein VHEMI03755 [[Torrubiella] hemipterigena]
MALKRKRSMSEMTSSTASSPFSSPLGQDSIMLNFGPRPFAAPAHLNSRTMKRFRDSRPSENEIHQRTLNILFQAQQQQSQYPESVYDAAQSPTPVVEYQPQQQQQQQQSLHSFWNINSKPTATNTFEVQQTMSGTSCEDCGANLASGSTGDGMDVDSFGQTSTACSACGKFVCFSCSVSNLGEQNRCLRCAKPGAWPETNGWSHSMF